MLKIQITLIVTLIVCVAFVSCDRAQDMLAPVTDDMTATGDTAATDGMMMVMKTIDPSVYMSWAHVALDAPTMSVAEAKEAMNPAATGAAHNPGSDVFTSRTVYFNETGAMANKAGTTPYPAGTMIIKAIMDETETAVDKVAVMMKSDDPMYAGHNGWMYAKYFLSEDGTPELKAGSHVPGHEGNGCHGCHAKATNDSVFVSLSMDEMMDETMMDDTIEDDMMDDEMEGMDDANGGEGHGDMEGAGDGNGAGDVQ